MLRSTLLFLLGLCLTFCRPTSALAQDDHTSPDAIPIKGSRSPDGRKNMVIIDTNGEGVAAGTVQIHEIKTGKLLGYFEWSGFGEQATADAFTVLWRPDSRAFAIKSEVARGYSECKIYALENGACYPVQLPNLPQTIAAKYHLKTDSKGSETPIKWLAGNRLILEVYNRRFGEDAQSTFQVTLQLPLHPVATVETIRPLR